MPNDSDTLGRKLLDKIFFEACLDRAREWFVGAEFWNSRWDAVLLIKYFDQGSVVCFAKVRQK